MPATTPRPPSSEQVAAFDRNAWPRSIGIPGRNRRNPHEARARGLCRLSLETGSGPAFEPALPLYRERVLSTVDAFQRTTRSALSQFLHLRLDWWPQLLTSEYSA
jgi:hypothetical protein